MSKVIDLTEYKLEKARKEFDAAVIKRRLKEAVNQSNQNFDNVTSLPEQIDERLECLKKFGKLFLGIEIT